MLWLSPKLRAVLTPPAPDAELKAAIASAALKHAKRVHIRSEVQAATHARLARELGR